jgi:hypothetical protein
MDFCNPEVLHGRACLIKACLFRSWEVLPETATELKLEAGAEDLVRTETSPLFPATT